MFWRRIPSSLSLFIAISAGLPLSCWSQGTFQITSPPFQTLQRNNGVSSAGFQVTASPSASVGITINASPSENWFTITSSSNCNASAFTIVATTPASLLACVDTNKVRFGVYSSVLTVTANNGGYLQARLPVSVTVFPPSEIKASVSSVALSSNSLQQTVFISYQGNNGENSSSASIAVVAPDPASPPEGSWLIPTNNCASVTLTSGGNSCSIVIAAYPVQLTGGVVGQTYSSRVHVESVRGDRADVDVTFAYSTPSVFPPVLTSGSLANGATYIAGGLVPGSWAQVKGSSLVTTSHIGWRDSDYAGLGNGLPMNLNGTTVQVNGTPAAVYAVIPTQINFQVPAGITGTASVQVFVNGAPSNVVTAGAANNSPGIFPCAANGNNYPCGYFPDGEFVGDSSEGPKYRKARPGDVVQMFGTGLAPSPAGVRVTQQTLSGVSVTIGTITVPADAAVLVYPGEFQVNFTVPPQFASLAEGNYPLTITVSGVTSPANINSNPPALVVLPIQH